MNRPEEVLHRSVADFLRVALPPYVWWTHPPNGGGRSRAEAGILKAMGVRAGTPDILIVHQGRAFWIELKAPKGRVEASQERCHTDLMLAGADVDICRSLEEVERRLKLWNIPLNARIA